MNDIDGDDNNIVHIDFSKLKTKSEIIHHYVRSIQKLETIAQTKYNVKPIEFADYLYHNFFEKYQTVAMEKLWNVQRQHQQNRKSPKNNFRSYIEFVANSIWTNRRQYLGFAIAFAIVICLVNYKTEASNLFMRNIQTWIYPGMRAWRLFTLPIIETFPSLTQFYDETCLIGNPFFQVANLNCKPCSRIVSVLDLTLASNMGQYLENNSPYFIKSNNTLVTIPMLYKLYSRHRQIFHENAYGIKSTQSNINNLDQLFANLLNQTNAKIDSHNLWRINRMSPARILRELFPRPPGLPDTAGIGVERYIAIDTAISPSYKLPVTDCSNMFVYMAKGTRTINLQPTSECQTKCRRLSFRLEENTFLFYDWWYWKPISIAETDAKVTTITYIGSYC